MDPQIVLNDSGVQQGPDGLVRCTWANGSELYRDYHDQEWGRPVHGDTPIFERMTLEAFQSGLSWLVILRKRENFRRAFVGFDPHAVAEFDDEDRSRLLKDAGIVRNRAKIDAAINNARLVVQLLDQDGEGALDRLMWRYCPVRHHAPRELSDIPARDEASETLSRELKSRGFKFLGPVTLYAGMQAMGMVDDHLLGCHRRGAAPTQHR
jgi:DNA-3-methyladenine glycosylase I